jgi:hypothetical protein
MLFLTFLTMATPKRLEMLYVELTASFDFYEANRDCLRGGGGWTRNPLGPGIPILFSDLLLF